LRRKNRINNVILIFLTTWIPALITGGLAFALGTRKSSADLKKMREEIQLNNRAENKTYMQRQKLEKAAALYAEMVSYVVTDFRSQFEPFLKLPKRGLTATELRQLQEQVWELGKESKTWTQLEVLLAYFPKIQSHFHKVRAAATSFTTVKTWESIIDTETVFDEDVANKLKREYLILANQFIDVQNEVLSEVTRIQTQLEHVENE
jgi:hypothetical protein